MNKLVTTIRKELRPIKKWYRSLSTAIHTNREFSKFTNAIQSRTEKNRIFYFGITENNNLGDNAQYYCILKWINKFFTDYELIQLDATTIVNHKSDFLSIFKPLYRKSKDLIILQSGYGIQDIGGNHIIMHKILLKALPYADVLIMPQTINFREKYNGEEVAKIYNNCPNLFLIARDRVSYNIAQELFYNVKTICTPDIVTSLIGCYNFNNDRDGFLIIHRNDQEQFYSNSDINNLKSSLLKIAKTEISDTTIELSGKQIRKDLEKNITKTIDEYSKYKVIITDRFHGTIFSLCANTPVIVLKTSDHKVVTGAEWFTNIYPEHIKIANSIDECIYLAQKLYYKVNGNNTLSSYFNEKYFDKTLYEQLESSLNRKL